MIPGFDPRIMLAAPSGIVLPNIGDPWEGGFYAGLFTILDAGDVYALIVGPGASEPVGGLQWKTSQTNTNGTGSVIDGLANSNAMNNNSHPAAQYCRAYSGGGKNDWFLPAQLQLEMAYRVLKPTTAYNSTSYGSNVYSIPPTGNYKPDNPKQTPVSNFKSSGADAFIVAQYWASSQNSASLGERIYFMNGAGSAAGKANIFPVRPFRQVRIK